MLEGLDVPHTALDINMRPDGKRVMLTIRRGNVNVGWIEFDGDQLGVLLFNLKQCHDEMLRRLRKGFVVQ